LSLPGLYGSVIDGAHGRELDRVGAVFGVRREPARFWRWRLPWGQRDKTLRARIVDVVWTPEWRLRELPSPPCIHNVVAGYDWGMKCLDCGREWPPTRGKVS